MEKKFWPARPARMRIVTILLLLLAHAGSGQTARDLAGMEMLTPGGEMLTLKELIQDESPLLWVCVRPDDPASERFVDGFSRERTEAYRAKYGLRVLFFYPFSADEVRNGALLRARGKRSGALLFALPDRQRFNRFPYVLLFNGEGRLLHTSRQIPGGEEVDTNIRRLPRIKEGAQGSSRATAVETAGIVGLFGKSEADVIRRIGLPEWADRGDRRGDILHYPGFEIVLTGGQVTAMTFTKSYRQPLLGDVAMGMSRNRLERKLGSGTVLETAGGRGRNPGYVRAGYFNNQLTYKYYHNPQYYAGQPRLIEENTLFELSLHGGEGAMSFLMATLKEAVSTMETKRDRYNVINLVMLLGRDRKTVVETLGPADVSVPAAGGFSELVYRARGFSLSYNTARREVLAVTFHTRGDGIKAYPHPLPLGLSRDISPAEALNNYGTPDVNEISNGMRVLKFNRHGLLLAFDMTGQHLQRVMILGAGRDAVIEREMLRGE